ncbi:MAG: hypothetical protein ACRCS3_05795, partial [Paracoccaceae bacterium]
PPAAAIAGFDPVGDVSPVGEVRLTGIWLRDLGVGSIVKDGVDDAYIVIKDAGSMDYAVLFFPETDQSGVEAGLGALTEANGLITVAGFHTASQSDVDAVTADLVARNLAVGPPTLLLEPYFDDRAAALNGRKTTEAISFAIVAGVNLILLLITRSRFRAWRARVAVRNATAEVARLGAAARQQATSQFTTAQKAVVAQMFSQRTGVPKSGAQRSAEPKAAPPPAAAPLRAGRPAAVVKSSDPFANSPIHSPKGWFR